MRRERQPGQNRPVEDLFDVQHRKTKTFAAAAENAVLRFRGPVFERAECFEQISGVSVGGQRVR